MKCHWCGGVADASASCPHPGADPSYAQSHRAKEPAVRLPRTRRGSPEVPAPVPAGDPPVGERAIIQQYLLWHAVSVCHATCALCTDAIAWLERYAAVPIAVAMLRSANQGGRVTR